MLWACFAVAEDNINSSLHVLESNLSLSFRLLEFVQTSRKLFFNPTTG